MEHTDTAYTRPSFPRGSIRGLYPTLCRRVIQSMRSSCEQGYKWARPTDIHRAQLWAEMNDYIEQLPKGNTIFFSYDAMCLEPAISVLELEKKLCAQGINGPFDHSVFAISHASPLMRPKVACKRADGGSEMQPFLFMIRMPGVRWMKLRRAALWLQQLKKSPG